MTNWRYEMMKHIRSQRLIKASTQEEKRDDGIPFNKMVEQSRASTSEKKLFKVRSTIGKIKSKSGARDPPPPANSVIQKNVILIRPTIIDKEEIISQAKRSKKTMLKTSKPAPIDRFFERRSTRIDELSLQRIANFEALLPFLGTQKKTVEEKPEPKPKANTYDAEEARKKDTLVKKKREQSPKFPEKITGW